MMIRILSNVLMLALVATVGGLDEAQAQQQSQPRAARVKYGEVVTGEFTANNQVFLYVFPAKPRDRVTISVKPSGDTLQCSIELYEPGVRGNLLATSTMNMEQLRKAASKTTIIGGPNSAPARAARERIAVSHLPVIEAGSLSGSGDYRIFVKNHEGGVGEFKLCVEATLSNGTEIRAGDAVPDPKDTAPKAKAPVFSGIGFPGLPPVDFEDAVSVALPAEGVASGTISAKQKAASCFTFEAKEGKEYDLSLIRTKGDLHLGFVVLSPTNEVVAQSSLIGSNRSETGLVVTKAGLYTIGVYRIEIGAPTGSNPGGFEVRLKPHSASPSSK